MRNIALHIQCLRELERERGRRPLSRSEAFGFILGASLTALAVGGCCLLEQLALERLGLR